MDMDGIDEVYKFQRFVPTPEEAVGYFLPRLLRGETMHGAEKLIGDAEIYGSEEPKDLARRFAPVPTAVSTGDRFFFTTCKRNAKNRRCARGAGAGTWEVQKTEDVYDVEGVKIGESRSLSFKKGKGTDKASTGWVMEEYRCLLPQAVVAKGEMVLCRIHLAPNPPAAARQESDAYRQLRRQEPAEQAPAPQPAKPVAMAASAQKRPAPVSASDMSSCCKKTRIAAPVPVVPEPEVEYEDCPTFFTPAASEADDDTDPLSFSWEDFFGQEQTPPMSMEVENQQSVQEEEQTTRPIEAHDNIQQLELVSDEDIDIDRLGASIDQILDYLYEDEEEELQKQRSNHNAIAAAEDVQAPSFEFEGLNQFCSFAPLH